MHGNTADGNGPTIPPQTVTVLALGIVGQLAQVMLLREFLMVFHGNELSIGIILASWMIWVGIGSRGGAALVDRTGRPLALVMVTALGILALLPVTVLAIRLVRGAFDVVPGAYLSFVDTAIACLILMAPVCVLLGAQFVVLARLWRESHSATDTIGADRTYAVEATGNIIGGVLFTFVLVHVTNAFQAAVLSGALMLAALAWMVRAIPQGPLLRAARRTFWALAVGALIGLPALRYVDAWAYQQQWRLFYPGQELIETVQSRFGAISVARRQDQYSFFQSGHLLFSTAGDESLAVGFEEQAGAEFAHFALTQHAAPRRVLLLGGGLRGTLREILRHPVEHVDYIELDPVLTETARRFVSASTLEALDSPRVRLIHTDGRLFVKASDETYDVIIVDGPDPATAVLNRYYTQEFFREVESRLEPDGVFVTGVQSVADLRGRAVVNRNATLYHTLRSVFAHVLPAGERHLMFFATNADEQIAPDPAVLMTRYRERGIEADGFSAGHFALLLEETPLRRINWVLRNHGRHPEAHLERPETGPLFPGSIAEQEAAEAELPPPNPRFFINTDFRPIGYFHTLVFWNVLSRTPHGALFDWIMQVDPWWMAPLAGGLLFAAGLLRLIGHSTGRRPDTYFAVLFAVFTTGLSTMSLQIALLFSFQSIYGFVYEMVGLIVAIFMAGLALGTTLVHRYVRNKADMRLLAGVQAIVALYALVIGIALPLSAMVPSPSVIFVLFSALTFAAGFFNGVGFPLTAACCMALTRRAEHATGVVYGVELLGACCGATLASVVIAPVIGITACCVFAGIMNATAMAVVLLARRIHG